MTAVILAADPASSDQGLEGALGRLQDLLVERGTQEAAALRAAALTLRLNASRLRRRESELQRLLVTAQRLLSSAATGDLLDVIIGAVREMLSCDVAHLNLFGPEVQESGMSRVTEGELTEAFRRYRTPGTAGVTGVVRETKSPYVARDYVTDTRISHDAAADAAVVADGVRTMAGVPLLQGDDVIGVLVASYRSHTQVSTDQLGVMASLASLAVLALEAAGVMRQKEAALRELSDAHERARDWNSMLEWSSRMHDRLTGLVLSGAELGDVAREVGEAFDGPCVIVGSDGVVLGASPPEVPVPLPVAGVDTARVTGRAVPAESSDGRTVWMSPALAAGEFLAVVAVWRDVLSDVEQRALDRAGVVSALRLVIQRWLLEAGSRDAAQVAGDLLSGGTRASTAVRHARSLGLDTRSPCAVLVADGDPGVHSLLQRHALAFAREHRGLAGEQAGQVTLILPGRDPERLAEDLLRDAGGTLASQINVGAAGPVKHVDGLACAFDEARRCVDSLHRLGERGRVATTLSLGFAGLLLADSSGENVGPYVTRILGPVLDYDTRRGSQLMETIQSYFATTGSLRAAAEVMHVHPNTVLQRLQRVASLLGSDWLEPDRALEIQLAIRLHRILTPARRQ